jgi:hypothetical protein
MPTVAHECVSVRQCKKEVGFDPLLRCLRGEAVHRGRILAIGRFVSINSQASQGWKLSFNGHTPLYG